MTTKINAILTVDLSHEEEVALRFSGMVSRPFPVNFILATTLVSQIVFAKIIPYPNVGHCDESSHHTIPYARLDSGRDGSVEDIVRRGNTSTLRCSPVLSEN